MSLFSPRADAARTFKLTGAIAAACVVAFAGSLAAMNAQARGFGGYGDAHVRMMQVRGPGMEEERANERAMRQAARAQRQQQMQDQRVMQREPMQRAPEREPAAPQSPGFRPPDPGDATGRPGRLTPDERRALRQQINQAGRDVYRPNSRP